MADGPTAAAAAAPLPLPPCMCRELDRRRTGARSGESGSPAGFRGRFEEVEEERDNRVPLVANEPPALPLPLAGLVVALPLPLPSSEQALVGRPPPVWPRPPMACFRGFRSCFRRSGEEQMASRAGAVLASRWGRFVRCAVSRREPALFLD